MISHQRGCYADFARISVLPCYADRAEVLRGGFPRFHSEPVILAENLNDPEFLASLIDHTLLRPDAVPEDVSRLCREAREFGFCSVCVNPVWIRLAASELAGTSVRVGGAIGFPLGANEFAVKIVEANMAVNSGARELDMVQNIGALRAGDFGTVRREIETIAGLAHMQGALVKVILETCLLTEQEMRTACRIALEARADFVKTSTGFSREGARVEDVRLLRHEVGDSAGVKASGGIRTLAAVRQMISAGANRIGTSSGVNIVTEARRLQESATAGVGLRS